MQSSDNDIIQHGSGGLVSVFHLDLSYPNIWVRKIKIKLKQIEAYNIIVNVDDLEVEPVLPALPTPEEITIHESFKKRQRLGFTIITNSLMVKDDTVYLAIIIDEAYEADDLPGGWETLMQTLYIAAPSNRRKLQQEFLSIKQQHDEPVQKYADRLDNINQKYSLCTDLHEGFDEEMVCSQFLNGLSPSFDMFTAAVELGDTPLTYRTLIKKAQLFEIKKGVKDHHVKEQPSKSPFSKHEVQLLYSSDAQRNTYGKKKPLFNCKIHGCNTSHNDSTCRLQQKEQARIAGDSTYHCQYHGENDSHATDDCKVLHGRQNQTKANHQRNTYYDNGL